MERDLFDWANVAMETIEIAALVAILWRLAHVQRDIRPLVKHHECERARRKAAPACPSSDIGFRASPRSTSRRC